MKKVQIKLAYFHFRDAIMELTDYIPIRKKIDKLLKTLPRENFPSFESLNDRDSFYWGFTKCLADISMFYELTEQKQAVKPSFFGRLAGSEVRSNYSRVQNSENIGNSDDDESSSSPGVGLNSSDNTEGSDETDGTDSSQQNNKDNSVQNDKNDVNDQLENNEFDELDNNKDSDGDGFVTPASTSEEDFNTPIIETEKPNVVAKPKKRSPLQQRKLSKNPISTKKSSSISSDSSESKVASLTSSSDNAEPVQEYSDKKVASSNKPPPGFENIKPNPNTKITKSSVSSNSKTTTNTNKLSLKLEKQSLSSEFSSDSDCFNPVPEIQESKTKESEVKSEKSIKIDEIRPPESFDSDKIITHQTPKIPDIPRFYTQQAFDELTKALNTEIDTRECAKTLRKFFR